MDKYSIFCSNEHLLNDDINEEVKKGNIPLNLSCSLGIQNINCCILMKKHIDTGKDYVPEPKILKEREK